MSRTIISQAVILAGGRGSRLRPITDSIPKPMIQFHGKPFLAYLVEMLREQGFKKILLLLGYLPDKIRDHFGDGTDWGIEISYLVSGVDDDTGLRIHRAKELIDDTFLLMYCDNYWPLQIERLWQKFVDGNTNALVTVYNNSDGYTKSNLRVGKDDRVEVYDKTRSAPNLQGVDIGFCILNKEVLSLIPHGNVSFERNVYPSLIRERQLTAYKTDHRYYSVGDHKRLPLTAEFFKKKKVIILDRDGVLNKKAPKAEYVKRWEEFSWLPGAKDALVLLKKEGFMVIVITNQAGIARGMMTENDLKEIHSRMIDDVEAEGGSIDAIFYCPHGWDDKCDCRKPNPGMLFQAQRDHHFDLTKTFFIGDDERDEIAGKSAGCRTLIVSGDYPLLKAVKEKVLTNSLYTSSEPHLVPRGS